MVKLNPMKSAIKHALRIILAGLTLLLWTQPATAFYAWEDDQSSVEVRGLLRGSTMWIHNPDNPLLYQQRSVSAAAVSARLMLDGSFGSMFSFEMHSELNEVPLSLQSGGSKVSLLQGVERSSLPEQSFDHRRSHLLLDRLNVQYASPALNLKIGRQPVNLAATYFFTPNDFFAPFAAQTFFRAYKPGVDAMRADIRLGELSQLSLISVLGYRADTASDNGWNTTPDAARHAYLARASSVTGDFEMALLVGKIKKEVVLGGDLQGELFEWLGIRAEGHVNIPRQNNLKRKAEVALGIEHRWENTFNLRAEYFYHGAGLSAAPYALSALPALSTQASVSQGYYMARQYIAVGAGYEFMPLLSGDVTALYNGTDRSTLWAAYALYSLGDESELAISGSYANGKRPLGSRINSEFGLYGQTLSCELRSYF